MNSARKKRKQTGRPTANKSAAPRLLRPLGLAVAVALVVATPLIPTERAEMTGVALPLVMLWLLLALAWFGGAVLLRVPVARLGWIDAAMLALAGWHALSGLVMMRHGAPRLTVNAVWMWAGFAVTLIMLRQLLRMNREIRALCVVMLGLAVCLSVAGIYQTFVVYPQDRAMYERDPEAALQQAGISAAEGTAQRKQFEDRLYSNEPTATFSLTNSLAGFLAPWLVVLLGITLGAVRWPSKTGEMIDDGSSTAWEGRRTFLIAALAGVALIGFCLLLTKSRTGWLAAAMGCAVVLGVMVLNSGKKKHLIFAACGFATLIALVALLTYNGILDVEILTQAIQSLKYRFEYWQSTLMMIADHPLLGCGPGNFQQVYTAYKLPEASETVADPHNFLMEIAATAGLPALLLLLGLLALVALKGSGVFFSAAAPEASEIGKGKKTPDPVGVRSAYAGGVAGIVLAILVGVITGYLPSMEGLLLGAAIGGVFVWLMNDWVLKGSGDFFSATDGEAAENDNEKKTPDPIHVAPALPRWLLMIAIAVLLVNLLAAGGIGFPGVVITLWVLIAVLHPARSAESTTRPSRPLAVAETGPAEAGHYERVPAIGGAAIAAVLLAACYFTAYRPVLVHSGHMTQAAIAMAGGREDGAIAALKAAAAADPLASDAHLQLATLYFQRWNRKENPDASDTDYQKFQRQVQAALRLDPKAHQKRALAGNLYLQAYARTGGPSCRDAAVAEFQEAVRLYPHDAMTHAQLAWVADFLKADSDKETALNAQELAAEALRLDQLCPHSERKLAARRLFAEMGAAPPEDGPLAGLGEKNAEQWMREIRNKADAQ